VGPQWDRRESGQVFLGLNKTTAITEMSNKIRISPKWTCHLTRLFSLALGILTTIFGLLATMFAKWFKRTDFDVSFHIKTKTRR